MEGEEGGQWCSALQDSEGGHGEGGREQQDEGGGAGECEGEVRELQWGWGEEEGQVMDVGEAWRKELFSKSVRDEIDNAMLSMINGSEGFFEGLEWAMGRRAVLSQMQAELDRLNEKEEIGIESPS